MGSFGRSHGELRYQLFPQGEEDGAPIAVLQNGVYFFLIVNAFELFVEYVL